MDRKRHVFDVDANDFIIIVLVKIKYDKLVVYCIATVIKNFKISHFNRHRSECRVNLPK